MNTITAAAAQNSADAMSAITVDVGGIAADVHREFSAAMATGRQKHARAVAARDDFTKLAYVAASAKAYREAMRIMAEYQGRMFSVSAGRYSRAHSYWQHAADAAKTEAVCAVNVSTRLAASMGA